MITSFDRQTIRTINAEVQDALAEIGDKYGVQISLGGTSFSPTDFTTKFTCAVISSSGVALTREAIRFQERAPIYGITLGVGDSFTHRGQTYTISGWKERVCKYPIIATRGGKTYKLAIQFVKMHQ